MCIKRSIQIQNTSIKWKKGYVLFRRFPKAEEMNLFSEWDLTVIFVIKLETVTVSQINQAKVYRLKKIQLFHDYS